MLRRYWEKIGGILIEEFLAVRKAADRAPRYIDGIIIRSQQRRIAEPGEVISLRGEHITVVQVKTGRLGMYLMGQALFSIDLMRAFEPASVESVALCEQSDAVLQPLFERHPNCRVVTMDDLTAK